LFKSLQKLEKNSNLKENNLILFKNPFFDMNINDMGKLFTKLMHIKHFTFSLLCCLEIY
jgi:hypothetical protein